MFKITQWSTSFYYRIRNNITFQHLNDFILFRDNKFKTIDYSYNFIYVINSWNI